MRRRGTRDPRVRLLLTGEFFGDEEKGMAFTVRMQCMMELNNSPKAAPFVTRDPNTTLMSSGLAMFFAAALAPLHYDDDNQFFNEDEFFEIGEREKQALIATEAK